MTCSPPWKGLPRRGGFRCPCPGDAAVLPGAGRGRGRVVPLHGAPRISRPAAPSASRRSTRCSSTTTDSTRSTKKYLRRSAGEREGSCGGWATDSHRRVARQRFAPPHRLVLESDSHLQTGYLYTYAFAMIIGLVTLMSLFVFLRMRASPDIGLSRLAHTMPDLPFLSLVVWLPIVGACAVLIAGERAGTRVRLRS